MSEPALSAWQSDDKLPEIEGLVLSVMDYKEHDGLVTLATPQGLVKVYARGIQKEASKNRRLMVPFTHVRIIYDPKYSREFLYLIHGTVLDSWWKNTESLELQTINALLASLISQYGITEAIYSGLETFWKSGHEGNLPDAILAVCKIVIEILRNAGVILDVDECVICQRTDRIAGISQEHGGFVCLDHLDAGHPARKEDLILLRRLAHGSMSQLLSQPIRPHDYGLLLFLFDWYQYATDLPLRSLNFLKTLCKSEPSF